MGKAPEDIEQKVNLALMRAGYQYGFQEVEESIYTILKKATNLHPAKLAKHVSHNFMYYLANFCDDSEAVAITVKNELSSLSLAVMSGVNESFFLENLMVENCTKSLKQLLAIIEAKDESLGIRKVSDDNGLSISRHSLRVSNYSTALADRLGIEGNARRYLIIGSMLHDIGKIAAPDRILENVGKLSQEDFNILKEHPERGVKILQPYNLKSTKDISDIVEYHHERWDGSGYPKGIKGEEIPYNARIIAVADSFDAMVNARPWKEKQKTAKEAAEEIKSLGGKLYDPNIAKYADCLIK